MGNIQIFFDVSVYAYLLATVVFSVWFFWQAKKTWIAGCVVLGLGIASQVAFLIAMGIVGGRPPFSNTFEMLVLFAACAGGFFFVMVRNKAWHALSPLVVSEVFNAVKELREMGTTILLVEQDIKRALEMADRTYLLENGRIVMEGTRERFMQNGHIRKAYLGL